MKTARWLTPIVIAIAQCALSACGSRSNLARDGDTGDIDIDSDSNSDSNVDADTDTNSDFECGTTFLEDNFDSGVLSSGWESIQCCQTIVGGKLRLEDTNGWPRDAEVVAHDGDAGWTDYEVDLTAEFGESSNHFNILLRSNHFSRSSAGCSGTAYQLEFFGDGWVDGEPNQIGLTRTDCDAPVDSNISIASASWSPMTNGPFQIHVRIEGGSIEASVDGEVVIEGVDPDPLPSGGLGLHTIWESVALFDDVWVCGL